MGNGDFIGEYTNRRARKGSGGHLWRAASDSSHAAWFAWKEGQTPVDEAAGATRGAWAGTPLRHVELFREGQYLLWSLRRGPGFAWLWWFWRRPFPSGPWPPLLLTRRPRRRPPSDECARAR